MRPSRLVSPLRATPKGSAELLAALIMGSLVLAYMSYVALQWNEARRGITQLVEYVGEKAKFGALSYSCLSEGLGSFVCYPVVSEPHKVKGVILAFDVDGNGAWDYLCPGRVKKTDDSLNVSFSTCYGPDEKNVKNINEFERAEMIMVIHAPNYLIESKLVCSGSGETLACGALFK